MSDPPSSPTVPRFTLDTACVIGPSNPQPPPFPDEHASLLELIELAASGAVDLQLTVAYDRDFDRYKYAEGRVRQSEWLAGAPILASRAPGVFRIGVSALDGPDVIASEEDVALDTAMRRVLLPDFDGKQWDESKRTHGELAKVMSDLDHLTAHYRSGALAFVTWDVKTILCHREALTELGITVCWPSEALTMTNGAPQ